MGAVPPTPRSLKHCIRGAGTSRASYSVLPPGVAIALVKKEGLLVVLRNLEPILVLRGGSIGVELGLVYHANKLTFAFGDALETYPPGRVQKTIPVRIQCAGDRVTRGNDS